MLPSSENSYHLQSVVVHTGDNYQSGHYTSFVKSSDWYLTDDMNLKVKIFDLPQVSSSTNSELKKKLRETKTPLEALYVAGKFLYE